MFGKKTRRDCHYVWCRCTTCDACIPVCSFFLNQHTIFHIWNQLIRIKHLGKGRFLYSIVCLVDPNMFDSMIGHVTYCAVDVLFAAVLAAFQVDPVTQITVFDCREGIDVFSSQQPKDTLMVLLARGASGGGDKSGEVCRPSMSDWWGRCVPSWAAGSIVIVDCNRLK